MHDIKKTYRLIKRERGATTLIVAAVLLVVITMVTLITARTAVMEQRTSSNVQRSKQAFAAAEAGLDYAVAYMGESGGVDHDGDDTADTLAGASLTDGSSYTVAYCTTDSVLPAFTAPTAGGTGGLTTVTIFATGRSDDNSATRYVSLKVEKGPALANPPTNPLTARGLVDIRGSGTITNPEGNATIWSGHEVDFTGNSGKTAIPNPAGSGNITSSDKDHQGPDVVEQDGSLSTLTDSQYFENFFGATPSVYKTTYASKVIDPDTTSVTTLDGDTGEIIWVDGDSRFTSNTTIGTADEPVVLIVDGNVFGAGHVTVNGIVYFNGDWTGTGNLTINGAAVIKGQVNGTGSLDVIFDSTILANTNRIGKPGALPGTWKDWL